MKRSHAVVAGVVLGSILGCSGHPARWFRPADLGKAGRPAAPEEGKETIQRVAKLSREKFRGMSFEAFKAQVYREPEAVGGKYIVNGDTTVLNDKQLEEFFQNEVKKDPPPRPTHEAVSIVVHQVGGQDAVWNSSEQHQLTYCVSKSFGARYPEVVSAMEAATHAWEAAADIDYIHVDAEDESCTASNTNVVFDVRPVNVSGQYLARAFFPNEPRSARNVLIDGTSFGLNPSEKLSLLGILRHELGHTLGFRHEHTRPESGACFEDNDWRPLTSYDPLSVMHYPQCNGGGDWGLTLTHRDQNGAACLYGAAPGFTVDSSVCQARAPGPGPCKASTRSVTGQSVAAGQENAYGPFAVSAGTLFEVKMQGSGDPDLYVRLGTAPSSTQYDCRPYLSGADETCSLDVLPGKSQAFIMVRGYTSASYSLTITHTP